MGKQQSGRRECSCSKSGEVTVWHDPPNNRCSLTHSGKYTHDKAHTYPLLLTEAKSLPYIYTCTKYMRFMWPCPYNGTHLRYNLCDSGKQNRWDAHSSWISSWHWYSDLLLSGGSWHWQKSISCKLTMKNLKKPVSVLKRWFKKWSKSVLKWMSK